MEPPKDPSRWVKTDVPDDYSVIGLKCCTSGDSINKLGFIAWKSNDSFQRELDSTPGL